MTPTLALDALQRAEAETLEALLRDLAGEPDRARELLSALERQDRETLAAILAELEHGPRRGSP